MIIYQKIPRLASENLAINKICAEIISENKVDFLARFYYHKKGVILANNQSIKDLYEKNCNELGYEVSKRTSGGSSIIVSPKLTLCYSLFFKPNFLSTRFDFNTVYKKITCDLIKNLGKEFEIKGNYYLRFKGFPIAGHAIKSYSKAIQFDGVLHLTSLDVNEIFKLIKLRKLVKKDEKNYILIKNQIFNLRGKKVDLEKKDLIILRDEKEELGKIIGLPNTNLSLDDFLAAFYKTINSVFGPQEILDEYSFDVYKVLKYKNEILDKKYLSKGRINLGHCFVDLLEPEEEF
jgi:lipoate-protein ligase A